MHNDRVLMFAGFTINSYMCVNNKTIIGNGHDARVLKSNYRILFGRKSILPNFNKYYTIAEL